MLNVSLAGDHLYGKLLFTWLSLVMSLMVSYCLIVLSFSPRDVLDEIWDLSRFLRVFLPTFVQHPKIRKISIEKVSRRFYTSYF